MKRQCDQIQCGEKESLKMASIMGEQRTRGYLV